MPTCEERVDSLESILAQFILNSDRIIRNQEIETRALKSEMLAFKDEMKEFKDEMLVFKDEMRVFKDEMRAFKDEMKVFKDEMKVFKDEMKVFVDVTVKERREMNKQLGGQSQKLGTIMEDLVAPTVNPCMSRYFSCEAVHIGQRMKRRIDSENYEVDVLASCEDMVFVVEVKATVRTNDVDDFLKSIKKFPLFFPEYADMKRIPILGSIAVDKEVISTATEKGVYVMAYREWDYMDILNFDDIKKAARR